MRFLIPSKLLFIFSLFIFYFFGCGDDKRDNNQEIPLYEEASFPVGVAVQVQTGEANINNNESLRGIVEYHFNSVTAENEMKPDYIHPLESQFNWQNGDELLEFATEHGKIVHGHTLVWHNQVPAWMTNYTGDWEEMLETHIKTIVEHYSGKVDSWDVVNEAFEDDGSLRQTIWSEHVEDYIAKSFIWAREADPTVKLFYNDYNIAGLPQKLNTILDMVDVFKNRGVPIDGIGFQMHILLNWPSINSMSDAFTEAVERDLFIRISELDVSMNYFGDVTQFSDELADEQKNRYYEVVSTYKNVVPETSQAGITVWGVSDRYSWIRDNREDWPLLFDENWNTKPAFYGFLEALEE